jgi:hypothetical protein
MSWGYLISKANEEVFEVSQSHLIVCTAIMALGATRQTKSHVKATLGLGNSVKCLNTVGTVVTELLAWADRPPLGSFDIEALAEEIKANLEAQRT